MVKQNTTIIYENTVAGTFVSRMNRFTAEVLIDGAPQIVHVKNTGRLQELLMPEAKVTLQKTLNPNRKTAYDLISVYKPKAKMGEYRQSGTERFDEAAVNESELRAGEARIYLWGIQN